VVFPLKNIDIGQPTSLNDITIRGRQKPMLQL